MLYGKLKDYINEGKLDSFLKKIYCVEDINSDKERYLKLLDDAFVIYGDGDYHFISSPGRSEIGGNHTDHQHGHVLAASLNYDNLAVVKKREDNLVNCVDALHAINNLDLSDLSIHKDETNTSQSLIRGIAAKLNELGYQIGGFDALCHSRVLVGSGISSSACFEMLIVEIFNYLYNQDKVDPVLRAIIGKYAENIYFGKPSGLLDQMAISVGDFVAIDFYDIDNPTIEKYDFSFADYGYQFVLVDTKGDHSDLSYEYAAIPNEIKEVAKCLNVEHLAYSSLDNLLANIDKIRKTVNNDRAILRSIHFFLEDQRAIKQKEAVKNKDINELLKLMKESGRSSYEYLQNVSVSSRLHSQSLALALAMCDICLKDDGAYRVHGGGFEGTIQAIVPFEKYDEFKKMMHSLFGEDCLLEAQIRPLGTVTVI